MGLNNPLPSSLESECRKCGKILTSFIDPRQALSPDKVIPPDVLRKAKGLAILTVIKAGFLGSARFGSGLVVARLGPDKWSAPTAIMTGGAGFGGQIGFEITDFVFILNDRHAVKTFSQAGSITLGGNVSVAAGPVGRNAEAAGAASLKSVAGIFSYSKTKGLFAGVSLEGSAIIERKDANQKLYGQRHSAEALLSGEVAAPPAANPLMDILGSEKFRGDLVAPGVDERPASSDPHTTEHVQFNHQQYQENQQYADPNEIYTAPQRASTWQSGTGQTNQQYPSPVGNFPAEKKAGPTRPVKPSHLSANQPTPPPTVIGKALALYSFAAVTTEDISFNKGDEILITKKTSQENEWWEGMISPNTKPGTFPGNYVRVTQ